MIDLTIEKKENGSRYLLSNTNGIKHILLVFTTDNEVFAPPHIAGSIGFPLDNNGRLKITGRKPHITRQELLEMMQEYCNWGFCHGFKVGQENIPYWEHYKMLEAHKRLEKLWEIDKVLKSQLC